MSYSLDFLRQVFKVQSKEKLNDKQLCVRFGISTRTLYRWQKNIAPVGKRNRPATNIDMEALNNHLEEFPDAYQYERAAHCLCFEAA